MSLAHWGACSAVYLATSLAQADARFSLEGQFGDATDLRDIPIKLSAPVASPDLLVFRTWSHSGSGANHAGDIISAGGFDPTLELFDIFEDTVAFTDNGTGIDSNFDSLLSFAAAPTGAGALALPDPLAAGEYTLRLEVLNDDFNERDRYWALDLTGPDDVLMLDDSSFGGGIIDQVPGSWGMSKVSVIGIGSQWSKGGNLFVGDEGEGTLIVEAGGVVTNRFGGIGWHAGSTGQATVTGQGSQWNSTDNLVVGYQGDGTLIVEAGGVVSINAGDLAQSAGSTGQATVTGPGSQWNNGSNLRVGNEGDGVLFVEAGGVVTSSSGSIGDNSGSTGQVIVTGQGSQWNSGRALIVGHGGSGTLLVEAGGVVSCEEGVKVNIGNLVGSTGHATVTGEGSQWNCGGVDLRVGSEGEGTLLIEAGGVVSNAIGGVGWLAGSTGQATVTGQGSQWNNANKLVVGALGSGTMRVEAGGVLTSDGGGIGESTGGVGLVTVTGPGSQWNNTKDLNIGFFGEGALLVEAGGVVTNVEGSIGRFFDSAGQVTVTGPGSQWNNTGILRVGTGTSGTLLVEAGGVVSSDLGQIGSADGSTGQVTVTGQGSQWNNVSDLGVGGYGDGTLLVEAGGVVSNNAGYIARGVSSTSQATVTGPGSLWNSSGDLTVGHEGDGTLNVEAGGVVNNANGIIGDAAGSTGQATVTGVGSQWNNSGDLLVGSEGDGTLNIEAGGLVTVGGVTTIGPQGALSLTGGTLDLLAADSFVNEGGKFAWEGTVRISGPGGARLGNVLLPTATSLNNGQVLEVVHTLIIEAGQVLAASGNGTFKAGALDLDGGTALIATLNTDNTPIISGHGNIVAEIVGASTTSNITATGTLALGNAISTRGFDFVGTLDVGGHRVILNDADQAELGLATNLAAGGSINAINGATLSKGEMLTATGSASVDGDFTNNGSVIGPTAVGQFLTFHRNVDGEGDYTGNVEFLQTFAPGDHLATVQFNHDLQLVGSTTLEIELGGLAPASEHDQLVITGQFNVNGVLNVVLHNDFIPMKDDTFDLFDFGSISGEFDEVNLPELSGNLDWDTSSLLTTGELSVLLSFILGDMDGNSALDAFDIAPFELALADKEAYEAAYPGLDPDALGDMDSSGVLDAFDVAGFEAALVGDIAGGLVPEPTAGILMLLGLAGSAGGRHRRRGLTP